MRRMYYHRFSGLRSCCIISSLPGLVIFIFSIVSPSSPIFLFFSSPLLPLYFRPFFFSPSRCTITGFVKGKRPSLVVALLSFPFFFTIVTITIIIFSRFFLLPCSVYHRITSRCVHGELDRPCSGRDDTGVCVLLRLLPIR